MKVFGGIIRAVQVGIKSMFSRTITKNLDEIQYYSNARLLYKIDHKKCINCKLCVNVCPCKAVKVLGLKPSIDPDACSNCNLCYRVCPANAIENDTQNHNKI